MLEITVVKPKEILNKTEAAIFLGVHRQTLRSWNKRGFGPKFSPSPNGREYTTLESCREFIARLSDPLSQPHLPRTQTEYETNDLPPATGIRGGSQ